MARKTRLTVYVDKDLMKEEKVTELCDAVFTHLVKKELDIAKRKQFLAEFIRANGYGKGREVIDQWVVVRDVATFPFRFNIKDGELSGGDLGDQEITTEEKANADTGDQGGVPVDDQPVGE